MTTIKSLNLSVDGSYKEAHTGKLIIFYNRQERKLIAFPDIPESPEVLKEYGVHGRGWGRLTLKYEPGMFDGLGGEGMLTKLSQIVETATK